MHKSASYVQVNSGCLTTLKPSAVSIIISYRLSEACDFETIRLKLTAHYGPEVQQGEVRHKGTGGPATYILYDGPALTLRRLYILGITGNNPTGLIPKVRQRPAAGWW